MIVRYRPILSIMLFGLLATQDVALAKGSNSDTQQFVDADSIDIDGDGEFDALTDGLLLLRSMFELTDSALISNVIGRNAVYSDAEEIEYRISSISTDLDIDNDGQVDALTDGLLILRYLFELNGESLVSDVISINAQRTLPEEIELYLDSLATHNINFISSKNFSVPENQKQIGKVSAVDADGGFVSYSLAGADAAFLTINSINGDLFFNQPPDYELKSSYEVVATVSDGADSNIQTIRISVTDVDDVAPVFTSGSAFAVPENQKGIGSVAVNDVDSQSTFYSITGSDITVSTDGVLSFVTTPDFEQKSSYNATITASDGTNQSEQAISITITNINDVAPVITSSVSFTATVTPDVEATIGVVTATDVDSESLNFSINSAELLISDSGVLSFSSEQDQDGDKTYSGIVSVTDGTFVTTQTITVSAEYDTDGDGSADNRDPDDDNDGVPDNSDDFPKDPLESVDTDGDGIGNNADTDDDNDGVLDVADEFPLDAGNVIDSDGDGVVDRNDVFPSDPSQQKALSIDFKGAASLGLGEVIDDGGSTSAINLFNPDETNSSVFAKLKDFFVNKAWANQVTLSSLTNIINWDVDGSEVLDTILSNQTIFIAGADVTPDGDYLYLLTSAHIQRAIPNLDQEFCSIYRVKLEDYTFECLLNTVDGDIQPKSLNPHITLDFSRGNIAFRSDGTGLLHGFNWKQLDQDPLSNGVALGSVWIMSPEGVLTPIPKENGFEVNLAVWVNDDYFASHEWFFDGENLSQERIAIYEASTLERVKLVEANGASQGVIKFNGDLYWSGGSLNGNSLEEQDNPVNGLPIVDAAGERLYGFANTNDPSNAFSSEDGSITLNLTDGVGGNGGYNYQKQSGVGTDIKYSAFNFTDEYIGYMKIYAPETPIVSIDGNDFGSNQTISLSDDRGQLEIQSYRDIFLITPSTTLVGDLVIDYVVDVDGVNETRQLLIDEQTIQNWRDDENSSDWLEWASPESEQEGFCIYAIEVDVKQCVKFEDYASLTTDMESFRSTRYHANPVYPHGSGKNAFPGIQSILFTGDDFRVYFKDSEDDQYYEASANLDDFIANGTTVLAYSGAENGSGESNIIAQGISLKPSPMQGMAVTVTETASQELTINFAQSLSAYAPLPSFEVWNGIQAIPLAEEVEWSEARDVAIIRTTSVGWTGGLENEVRILDPLFIVNSIQRYKPESILTFVSNNTNDNTPEFQSSSDFAVEENNQEIGVVQAIDADGDLVNYLLSDGDVDLLRIDVGSGELIFNELPDYEQRVSYSATVTATDGINASTQAVSITVLDIDDEPPVFTSPSAFSAPENQTSIGEITATDVDSDSTSFTVDGDGLAITAEGTLTFITAPDYETKDVYSGVITATDGTNSATMDITIAIEDVDDPPTITSGTAFAAPENQKDVGTVTATDVDSDVLVFSLESDQLSITSDGILAFVDAPDYEAKTSYAATVSVTDGINIVSQVITVSVTNVDDVAPTITSPSNFAAEENQLIVGNVTATDVDSEVISFEISGENLAINADELITFVTAPDYETKSTYTGVLTASDGTNSSEQEITIEIIDVVDEEPPVFVSGPIFSAEENQTQIGVVTVTDENSSEISLSISGSDMLIASDGTLSFIEPTDYENKPSYTATITASDGSNESTQDITVNIINLNDNSPVISSGNVFDVLENQTSIGTVTATDADGDSLTYSVKGTQGTNSNNAFIQDSHSSLDETDFYVVSPSAGQSVTLRIFDIDDQIKIVLKNSNGVSQQELIYEMGSDETLNVLDYITADGSTIDLELTNSGAGYTMGWELSVAGEVAYSNSCGQFNVSGCAGDSYSSGIVYEATIQLGIAKDNISINESSGQLTFDTAPDFETKDSFEAIVSATDGVNSADQTIKINIIDAVDEQPPVFTSTANFDVFENTLDVGTVTAKDDSGVLTFSVSDSDSSFAMSEDGNLKFTTAPNYELKSIYSVNVFVNDGTYTVKQEVTVSIKNVLEDVISESFVISDGTSTEPPRLSGSIELDELNLAKNVYLSLTGFDSQSGNNLCSLGYIYQVFELTKDNENTWSVQTDLRPDLSENCTYVASYYMSEDDIEFESVPPQDGTYLRIADTELLTDATQFAMKYSASEVVTISNTRSSSDQPTYSLYRYDQVYPDECVVSDSFAPDVWGKLANWDAACFNAIVNVNEIDDNFMSINFSILSDLPIESSFSILAAPKATLDTSYDEYRDERNEPQINRGIGSQESYPSTDSIENGKDYVVDFSARVHKTTPNAALYLRSYMFAHNSNFGSQPFLLYSGLSSSLDAEQEYDTTPPILTSLSVSDYADTNKPDRDFKKFTAEVDNLKIDDDANSPIRDIWINTVDSKCRTVRFDIRDEADGLLSSGTGQYVATIPFLKQQLGNYQITQIVVNDHALNASLYGQKSESTHPSVTNIFSVGSASIVSCPHFNNYATDVDINVSVGEALVGDFSVTVSSSDSVTYRLERASDSDFDIDLLTISETGELSFLEAVTQDTVGGKFRITATSVMNSDLVRELFVTIVINTD